ncbi:hypothetical protein BKA63DRAFT_25279 [Paraphoma chrysanthemicola]|nr:hypothetical protein BKA63DRAFT_25279 [Paraphoma chrysanthemicola]
MFHGKDHASQSEDQDYTSAYYRTAPDGNHLESPVEWYNRAAGAVADRFNSMGPIAPPASGVFGSGSWANAIGDKREVHRYSPGHVSTPSQRLHRRGQRGGDHGVSGVYAQRENMMPATGMGIYAAPYENIPPENRYWPGVHDCEEEKRNASVPSVEISTYANELYLDHGGQQPDPDTCIHSLRSSEDWSSRVGEEDLTGHPQHLSQPAVASLLQDSTPCWQTRLAYPTSRGFAQPASELSDLEAGRQMPGMSSDPWSAIPILTRQPDSPSSSGFPDAQGGPFDYSSSYEHSPDRVSSSYSQEFGTSTSDTSWSQIPEIMTSSTATLTQLVRNSRSSDPGSSSNVFEYHSRSETETREHESNSLATHNDAASGLLRVPKSPYGPSRSPSPTPSHMSVTSARYPDVLLCEEGGCQAMYSGKYRRGTLLRHMRLKHGLEEREYPCEQLRCEKSFKRQDARLKHYRKHHRHLL